MPPLNTTVTYTKKIINDMAIRRLFVDTSAWDALADAGDPHHGTALLFRDEIAERYHLLVTNYILDELYTLLLMNLGYGIEVLI